MKNRSLTAIATVFLLLIAQATSPVTAYAADNSWTNLLGDKWETATNWSLGVAPTNTQSAILITNAATKTITIDATTSGTFPSTLTISNLQLFAPATFANTLFLNNSGTLVPLEVLDDLIISNGGVLLISNSVLIVDGVSGGSLSDDGTMVLDGAGGNLITTNVEVDVGDTDTGQMTVSNGTWLALDVTVGLNAGSSGTLTIAGGTLLSSNVFISILDGSTGTIWMTAGQLIATNELLVGGVAGQMILSNGTVSTPALFVPGSEPR